MVGTPPHYLLALVAPVRPPSSNHFLAGYIPVDLFRPSMTHLDIPNSQFSHVFFEQACLIANVQSLLCLI